ncbi:hypothetical protein V5N11_009146 [Cardamine amara subsp. amara]|uniref:DUF4283 domain-containing protein n=1 Tax=Cardamine amara subsp. amara TaxID=228776 RepID=A0ABD1C9A9_CARAN
MARHKRPSPKRPPPPLKPRPSVSLPPPASEPTSSSTAEISPDPAKSEPAVGSSSPDDHPLAVSSPCAPSGAPILPGSSGPINSASASEKPSPAEQARGNSTPVAAVAQAKPKWIDLIKGPSTKINKKGTPFLLESGEICVQIPNEVIQRNHRKWDSFIVGQFHGNLPTHGALHAIFNGIWSNKARDITVSKLGPRTVLIRIPHAASRSRVLSQGMWLIEGQTMFVADWAPGLTPILPELTAVPVWMEFREVPPHFFSEEGLEHIAGLVGDPVCLHPSTANMTNLEVAKVLTIIDPTKEIPEAVNAQFVTGEISRVKVSCPWLPPICKHCKEMGHSIRRCPTAPITCIGCKSSAHGPDACPKNKKKAETVEKSGSSAKHQGQGKPKSSKKKRKTNGKNEEVKQKSTDSEFPPLIRDKSKGKGKAIETTRVSVSPKPKKGRMLMVDIGLEELKASCSTRKKAHPPTLPSKTSSSTIAVSASDSGSSSDTSSESESEKQKDSSSSPECTSEEESEQGFTPVLSRKQKKVLKKHKGSQKGPSFYLK